MPAALQTNGKHRGRWITASRVVCRADTSSPPPELFNMLWRRAAVFMNMARGAVRLMAMQGSPVGDGGVEYLVYNILHHLCDELLLHAGE